MKKRVNQLKNILVFSTLIIIALTTTSCKKEDEPKVFDMVAAQQAIDELNATYADAFTKGDASGVANCYTADAKFMPPNGEISEGSAAIKDVMSAFFENGAVKLEIKSVGLWGNEDILIQESTWAVYDKDGNERDHGKSLMTYKKEGDVWKIFRDCYNSNSNGDAPPPPPPSIETEKK
ncbi:YybH family protein [Flavobacterium sp. RSB2_4_14]|uniref:YybH family protein n=1 Tax=Flavobacterium sp. RSB2_4_14 TaxID=3447665 RepID=UPI003F32A27D